MSSSGTLARASAALIGSALLVCGVAGCGAAGVVASKVVGPPKVQAEYTPPKQPMLVLVENYHNPSAVMLDARQLANRLTDALRQYDVAPVINPAELEAVQSAPDFGKMTIPAVARAVGAKQVLYVNVRRFDVQGTVGSEMIKGTADMTAKIVDVATGATRWPTDVAGGRDVTFETPWLRQGEGADEASLRDQMSRRAADGIVKMLRTYSPDDDTVDQAVD